MALSLGLKLGLASQGGAGIPAPVNTVAPVASGSASVGSLLTCTTGTWTGSPTITYAYQWRRDAVDISGETASTYTVVIADDGTDIDCVVTATNPGGSASEDSNDIGPIVSATTTWDPADKAADVVLSNDNLTATNTDNDFTQDWARGTTSRTSSKYHVEFTYVAVGADASSNDFWVSVSGNGSPNLGVAVRPGGGSPGIYIDASLNTALNGGAMVTGTVVAMEVDVDTNEVWVQVNGQSRQGPFTSGSFANNVDLACRLSYNGGAVTVNAGQSAFAITPTSGFVAWG